ncbi:aspartate-semialdehyde dehydrogenase [Candidatus Saccharibacteria bacterium]|nr:aspartate-semialdehyde dehydrogenase [Candidatus Saccharibacteria bacterium]
MSQFSVAVVGATGAVGREMLKILWERKFPASAVFAVASERSAGSEIEFGDQKLIVENLENFDFSKVDIGLFSPGSSVSKIYAPKAASQGCVVIDNTSEFRQDPDVPLIIPEVNPATISEFRNKNIISNPNCSTIQMLVALKPLHDFSPINRVIVSTYQAVSGTGTAAIDELSTQSKQILNDENAEAKVYPKQIAFNVLPHIDDFTENGQTKEEMKMHNETRKIFADDNIMVSATTVRVPVVYGHSEAVLIETKSPISPEKARELLSSAPGVKLVDDIGNLDYPTAIDAAGKDEVFVGRIRKDLSNPNGLWLWIVSDNLRKGAALNSIQIAELLIGQDSFREQGN